MLIVSAIIGIALYVANRSSGDEPPRQ